MSSLLNPSSTPDEAIGATDALESGFARCLSLGTPIINDLSEIQDVHLNVRDSTGTNAEVRGPISAGRGYFGSSNEPANTPSLGRRFTSSDNTLICFPAGGPVCPESILNHTPRPVCLQVSGSAHSFSSLPGWHRTLAWLMLANLFKLLSPSS